MRNHGWEIPWGNTGKNAQGLIVPSSIIPSGYVHNRFAFHDVRRTAGEFHHFIHFEDVPHSLVPFFSVFLRAQIGQFLQIFVYQGLHSKKHLRTLGDSRIGPFRIRGLGSLDSIFDFFRHTGRRIGNNSAG